LTQTITNIIDKEHEFVDDKIMEVMHE